jgi:Flp pilus assembly protein TadD
MAQSLTRRQFLQATAAAGFLITRPRPLIADIFSVQFRKTSPYEELYRYIEPGSDGFAIEKQAAEITAILDRLTATRSLPLAESFRGRSPLPARYRSVADDISEAEFGAEDGTFAENLRRWLDSLGEVRAARFFVLGSNRVRYEIAGSKDGALEYRAGLWRQVWSEGKLVEFEPLEETLARASEPLFADVTSSLFGAEESFQQQLLHGVPYWRARLDSACGIDVYGQNGIAAGDIDNDGWDEVYVCQPGGLPNRLYKRRDAGTMEDITERAGVGLLDNTSCALFVDFRNSGRQDLVVLTAGGPVYFLNQGDGTFRQKPDAFRFQNAPQGAFTGMSAADYDGDGRVDLYLCTYIYFQSEDQYSYPAPYHDSRNGPPNFLFRNQLAPDGTGVFEDVTEAAGLENNDRYSFAPAWCDYNGDGRPDLYVANDFGRNNLYKNEGGRFRDAAAEAGVEDLGPGMSATWLDYDGDGRPDLYVTNMWSPAGQRVIESEGFPPVARDGLKEAYRRHTKGNTLYRNRGDGTFDETSAAEHVEMGRWSWTGDAFDFDCDGTPEIYVTAGMITNDSESDLMSFFWRQVVAKSPPKLQPSSGYENGWNAINQLIREDYSWNGREPNVFYARRGSRYYDFSGVSGLDFADDSRAFAATDFNGDGRLDLFLKSRLGPQIRALENHSSAANNVLVLALEGTTSNRDAIGAWVVVEHEGGKTAQALQAGSGYLSQHTKRLHFGLGPSKQATRIEIRWPSGQTERLTNLDAGHLYRVREGHGIVSQDAIRKSTRQAGTNNAIAAIPKGSPANHGSTDQPVNRSTGSTESTWLLEPVPLPEKRTGPGYVCLAAKPLEIPQHVPFDLVRLDQAGGEIAAWYAIFRRYLFDYRGGLSLPMLLLIDERSRAHKIYPAVPPEDELKKDLELLRAPGRQALALPFAGRYEHRPSRNYFRHGTAFFHAGYPEQALGYLEEVVARNPSNFKAQLALGQIHLQAERIAQAREYLNRAKSLKTDSPELWNNIGGIQMAEKHFAAAAESFERALALEPDLPFALVNAGQSYAQLNRDAEAERHLRRALEINSNDAEAANQLALLLIRQERVPEAKKLLEQAITADRSHVSAINNLAVLYIQENQLQDAIAALRYGISVAPQAEMLYLNLARIHVQSGDRERARDVLDRLLAEKPDSTVARNALRELGVQ